MSGEAAALGVASAMRNQYFNIGGEIYKQSDWGSIGLDLTGEISSIYMLLWDEKFRQTVRKLGLKLDLYARYVDDIVIICQSVTPGWYYDARSRVMKYDTTHPTAQMSSQAKTLNI